MTLGKVAVKPAANMDYFNDYERKRRAAGLTDNEVCAHAGVANSTVTRARREYTVMSRPTHERLCGAIGKLVRMRMRAIERAGLTQ